MQPRFHDLWQDWHDDLIVFARHQLPKLLAILLLAFILIRALRIITRKMVELSRQKAVHPAIRAQQITTVVGMIRSVGIFVTSTITNIPTLRIMPTTVVICCARIAGWTIGFGAQTLV